MPSLPNTADRHTISVVASGAVLAAIRARAEHSNLPLGQAAVALLSDGLDALAAQDAPTPREAVAVVTCDLKTIGADDLIAEVRERLAQLAEVEEVVAAKERAEAQLARVRAAMAGEDA